MTMPMTGFILMEICHYVSIHSLLKTVDPVTKFIDFSRQNNFTVTVGDGERSTE